MTIRSDHFIEEIKYSGKFELTEDETGFKSISPGGYLKYRRNEITVKAESNLKGTIEYHIYEGTNDLTGNEKGKALIKEAIREMIAWGFDANARMERIYMKGGSRALLGEIDSLKSDPVKNLYLNHIFAIDSLSNEDQTVVIKKIGSLGSDNDKNIFLKKISASRLDDPQMAQAYFAVLESMGSDMDKVGALQHMLDQDLVTDANAYTILVISSRLGADMDKMSIYQKLINRGLIRGTRYDSLLEKASLMGADMDKINLYRALIEEKNISDSQWIQMINKTAQLGSDMDKSNLLTEIAQKMPKTIPIKESYLKAARTISNDADYGKVIRALE
jgi:hypothetical protein